MTEKIEWYKEVLELEPNSKVFFPLARLLTEAQRQDEAIDVLEQGLARHEEFLEARLFLIELLHKAGRNAACEKQVTKLTGMFSAYSGFWQAWAACIASAGNEPDTAAVLRFLALNFSRGPVSLHEVINHGLASLGGESLKQAAEPAVGAYSTAEASAPAVPVASASAAPTALEQEDAPADEEPLIDAFAEADAEHDEALDFDPDAAMSDDEPLPGDEGVKLSSPVLSGLSVPVVKVNPAVEDESEEGEERFSLRTRSMAEVLAEQGDIKGALDIYHELEAASVHPEESADLRQRIATLSARLGSAQPAEAAQPQAGPESASGKDKLISMLEALAERVEARAHS